MDDYHSRRRLLQFAGTGVAASIAGCNALQDGDGTPTGTGADEGTTESQDGGGDGGTTESGGDDEGSGDGAQRLSLAVQPDQETLRQRQAEIQSQVQNGSMNRTAAQQEFQSAQADLIADAVSAFEDRSTDETGVSVEESLPEAGVLLVSGSPADLVATLEFDEVNALLSAGTYEQASQQTSG